MLVRLNLYALLKKPLSLANKINLERKRYVSSEAGRFARWPVRSESFRPEYEVVSPKCFSTGSKNEEKQVKFKIFFWSI